MPKPARFRSAPAGRRNFAALAGAAGILLLTPAAAQAQFLGPLEGLFRKIDGVTVFGSLGILESTDLLDMDEAMGYKVMRGVGVEVLIELQEMDPDSLRWGLELAFGADYMTGFVAREPTLDLRGSLRGLPTLSVYAAPPLEYYGYSVYIGVTVGFVQLWNANGFDPENRQYGIDGNTFQLGGSFGLYTPIGLFVEAAYRNRNFRSVQYDLPGGVDSLPQGWPRSMDMSVVQISLGFQTGGLTGGR